MTLHIYIGFDAIDHLAYRVCEASILGQTGEDVEIHPLRDWQLRQEAFYTRAYSVAASGQKMDFLDGRSHSTEFSYTRFLTPLIHLIKGRKGPCLFMDADTMLRGDIGELFAAADHSHVVQCVHHNHVPAETSKIVGVVQQQYDRKNWSSVMLFPGRVPYTIEDVNLKDRDWLHQMRWADGRSIGELGEEWNWLEGWSTHEDPKIVHFTRGTPDLPGWDKVHYGGEFWQWAERAGWLGHNIL